MAGAERDVRLNVIIDEDGRGARQAANDLDKIERSADKVDGALRKLGTSTQRVDRDIDSHRKTIRQLAAEYEKTGDVDVFRNIRKSESAIRSLEKVRKEITGLGEDGEKAGGSFLQGLSGPIGAIPSEIKGALILGVVAAAPVILAELGGAITAALGGGAIAAGIVLAAKDPRVGAAWSTVASTAMDKLSGAADVFVEPLIRASTRFGAMIDKIMPGVANDFAQLAPVVDRLAEGVAGLVERMMPGFNDAIRESVPILDAIAKELPNIGAAFGEMFREIAAGGAGGKAAFIDLLRLLESTAVSTGKMIEVTERWYLAEKALFDLQRMHWSAARDEMAGAITTTKNAAVGVSDAVKTALDTVTNSIINTGFETKLTSSQFQSLSQQINATAETADVLAGMMTDKIIGTMLAVDQATLGFDRSLITVGDTLTKNQGALTEHVKALKKTQTGEMENRDAVLQAVAANLKEYDSLIAAGISAEDAAAKYDENTASLEDQMRAAGYTQAQIDQLIGKYRAVPDRVNTTIATMGLTDAINNLADLLAKLFHVDGYVARSRVYVDTIYSTVGAGPTGYHGSTVARAYAKGGILAAAKGMVVSSPTVMFGERQTGREAYIPMRGIPASRGLELADTAARWHGGMVVPKGSAGFPGKLQVEWVGGNGSDEFMTWLRKNIRIRGGLTTALGT